MEAVRALSLLLLCYAIGGLSPSWLAVKWLGKKDLRTCGSGTLGATNAGRVLGRGAYVVIALLDILKGWAAVWLAARLGLTGWWLAAAGVAVVAGHVWPAVFKFRGGKGMAAAYGVIVFASPLAALLMWPVLGFGWLVLRSTTLAAVQAFWSAPLLVLAARGGMVSFTLAAALAGLIAWTHRANIQTALLKRKTPA
jgi:acyl phosphate:glycerol-3-phosphate acyltransferase